MKHLLDYINESRVCINESNDYLYHFTDLNGLYDIINNDIITTIQSDDIDSKINRSFGGQRYFPFTDKHNVSVGYDAQQRWLNVRIVFDGYRLRNRFDLIHVNDLIDTNKNNIGSQWNRLAIGNEKGSELRLFTNKKRINDIIDYILNVDVYAKDEENACEIRQSLLPLLGNRLNIHG